MTKNSKIQAGAALLIMLLQSSCVSVKKYNRSLQVVAGLQNYINIQREISQKERETCGRTTKQMSSIVEEYSQMIENASLENEQMRSRISSLEEVIAKFEHDANANRNNKLAKQFIDLKSRMETYRAELKVRDRLVETLRKQVGEKSAEINTLRANSDEKLKNDLRDLESVHRHICVLIGKTALGPGFCEDAEREFKKPHRPNT